MKRREQHTSLAPLETGDRLAGCRVHERDAKVLDGNREKGTIRARLDVTDPTAGQSESPHERLGLEVPPAEL
jgi:hypothetical protein